MDFHQQQNQARWSTLWLLLLMLLATALLILATNLLVAGFLIGVDLMQGGLPREVQTADALLARLLDSRHLVAIGTAVAGVIGLVSLYKWAQLSRGGRVIAEALGGRRLRPGQASPLERRLLNVVEEMAIASGAPAPAVYLLEGAGINAFAAGYTLHDAVIGVTEGALQQLNREELQGVIGHEFSHILNGDMRLNTQLIALLHGILFIHLSGRFALRMASESDRYGRDRNRADLLLFLFGLGLVIVGSAGMLVGQLIKAAVSRQREFLADASAVQFTRNPQGIAGALKRIGASAMGGDLPHRNAESISHLLFASLLGERGRWFATHPPLDTRIRRLEPGWDGHYPEQETQVPSLDEIALSQLQPAGQGAPAPAATDLERARDALLRLPANLHHAATEPTGAMAVVVGLLLSPLAASRQRQCALISEQHPDIHTWLAPLERALAALEPVLRLPLLELTAPALQELTPAQQEQLERAARAMIVMDGETDLSEWVVYHIAVRPLRRPIQRITTHRPLSSLAPATGVLLSFLAHFNRDGQAAVAAFGQASTAMGVEIPLPTTAIGLPLFSKALDQLGHLLPLHRPRLLKGCAACIDNSPQARELLRAIALVLDCPQPPQPSDGDSAKFT